MTSAKKGRAATAPRAGVRGYMLAGFAIIFLVLGGAGVWAAHTQISGAVIASGLVVVETSVKKVQHPTGGIVGKILVKNGDHVAAGDLLVRLDETLTRANLSMISKQIDELEVREARLKAERDGASEFVAPWQLADRVKEEAVAELLASERSLFRTRRQSREGQKKQLRERIEQLGEEYAGVSGQITAKAKEIELIGQELGSMEKLEAQQLVTLSKMVALRREAARLEGERGQLRSAAAQAKGKIAEIELQILRIDQDFSTEVVNDLTENLSKQAGLVERRVAAEDQLKRIDIRSPQAGFVHQLSVHTVGGVINAGEPVMLIVPENDSLVVEAKVAPFDIDQVLQSKEALIRLAAFNQRTTPEIKGFIRSVSADLTQDQRTGDSYYTVRVAIPEAELKRLENHKLVPGMPAEVHIRTQDRTALSYLLKPLQDQFAKAFKER
jgi:membrane fusion protein, type I secretion system